MQEKIIQKYQIWDHTRSIQKQPSVGIWKKILETYWLQKNSQGSPGKKEMSFDKPSACEKRWETFT